MYTLQFSVSTWILFFLLSSLLSVFFSEWVERLYWREPETLSYPAAKARRARLRKPFLALALALLVLPLHALPLPALLYRLVLFSLLLAVICTDFEQHVIFDRMLLPFAVLALPMAAWIHIPLLDCLFAAVAGGGFFLLLAILSRGGVGGGDIKLMAVLGLWTGTHFLLATAVLGLILGGAAALLFLLSGRKKRKEFFAYGPYFAASAIYFLL